MEIVKSRFKRVCVFCGSSSGKRECYSDAATDLAQELVTRRLNLVYGGGSIGLMGLVSQAVHEAGGHVLGYAQIYDLFTLVFSPILLYH